MDQTEEKKRIAGIYGSFWARLGLFRKKQLSFLKGLAEKKKQAELDNLRKEFPK